VRKRTRYAFLDFLYWMAFALIPVLIACYAIAQDSIGWVILYLVIFLGHFLLVEYRFFCTHCPHYHRNGKYMKCLFIWGVPKFYKKRPEKPSVLDLLFTGVGFVVAILLPLYWLIQYPFLLLLYFLSLLIFGYTVKRYECPWCIYENCPLNRSEVAE